MTRAAIAACTFVSMAVTGEAQPARITGRVVVDETGDAVRNARVRLSTPATGTAPITVLTDADGRFTLPAPAAPNATIVAGKPGYGTRQVPTTASAAPVEIRLVRGAVIAGRVVDRFGDPLAGIRVAAESASGGTAPRPPTEITETDDLGEYRLSNLVPGGYVVAFVTMIAPPPPPAATGSPVRAAPTVQKTYYPGVAVAADAQTLTVAAAEERPAIDFVAAVDDIAGNPFSVARLVTGPFGAIAAGQNPIRGSGVVRGRVVTTDLRAVPRAQVKLLPASPRQPSDVAIADQDGRFEFRDVVAGRMSVIASRMGYSPADAGGSATPLQAMLDVARGFELAEGQTRDDVEVRLMRWGTIAGRILDEYGDPVYRASVQLLQVRYEAGRRRLVPAAGGVRPTDDFGRYRVYAVPPGQYIVSAAVGDVASADLPGYARSYYPGTPNPGDAQFVSMAPSQEVVAIDFNLSRTRTARIAGRLLSAGGEPTTGGSLMLMPSQRSASRASVPVGASLTRDGEFEFANVPSGQYVVQVYRGRSNGWAEGEFGSLPVSVNDTDITDLVLQMSSGSRVDGRIVFDRYEQTKLPAADSLELTPVPVDFDLSPPNNWAKANIHDDWTFELVGMNGPRRLQLLRAPVGWALKEVRVNGTDATDRPLPFGRREQSLTGVEIILTDRVSELSGTIADDRGQPSAAAHLVVFSADRDRWYPASRFVRQAAASADGAFSVSGLPFGSYYAVALARLPADGEDAWQDPQFLESLIPRAASLTVGDAQKISRTFRLAAR